MKKQNCPICESGELHQKTEMINVEHFGKLSKVESRFLVCDDCGSEQAGAYELAANKKAMMRTCNG